MKSDHTHTCAQCGFVWTCLHFDEKKCRKSGVFKAPKVNGGGPYCELCRHIIMAERLASHRGFELKTELIPKLPSGFTP